MRIVCISDTHGAHSEIVVPDGDVLIHAGDISKRGKELEIIDFNDWLSTLPHRHKVIVAGNHDFLFERNAKRAEALLTHAVYLRNTEVKIEGLTIWGSPITPWFFDWAFNRQRGADIRKYWDRIPINTDILVTHGPPRGILDKTDRGDTVGCDDLLEAVWKVKPKLHLFGHIHEAYGQIEVDNMQFINASIMNLNYKPVNDPIIIDL
ncbi:metallophosphatase domain-containing protein [Cytophagaceae bacterium DM2B3-1]|uniref:Metallophosphatase domain-containing protein n=1 Tax=Xanthocytophaga flava TaxID=3048013 RepID=A0ABT7CCU0_9BACT|nr:metallophosphatase domain-containing protein [Xanthocytophaga flavus]MDJ1491489.1 metallophosphatase domain-containing protein [Xanthocytophaga flavus]